MAFFDVPEGLPPDLPDEEPRPKPWTGPPLRTVPALLTEQVVLAHTDRVAVVVGEFAVYPTGLTFSVLTVPRRYSPREWAGLDFHGYAPGVTESGELAPELLRYGIEFSDGRRATSLDTLRRREEDRDVAPASPLMRRWEAAVAAVGGNTAIGSGRFRRQDNSHSSANGPRSRSR
jgi:hypothetical protein